MKLTNHAKRRWFERCGHLNLNDELETAKQPGRKRKLKILSRCPAHKNVTARNTFYMVSKNEVVFVVDHQQRIVTVFMYDRYPSAEGMDKTRA